MTNKLATEQMCLFMRNGAEIWVDKAKAEQIAETLLANKVERFFKVEGRMVNIAELVGILTPADVHDIQQVRRGQWKCKYNHWHERNGTCECGRT